MTTWLRSKLTYANVVATLALFVALGGTSYAALRIGSTQIVNNSVHSVDVRNNDLRSKDVRNGTLQARDIKQNSLGGSVIRESRLGAVPNAERLGGRLASDWLLRCPNGTISKAGVCVEASARSPVAFTAAFATCSDFGRQLPDYAVLERFGQEGGQLAAPGEWTSSVYEGDPGQLKVVLVTTSGSGVDFQPALTPTTRPFRCVALPSN